MPESFKLLLKEMQSLGLDVQVLCDDGTAVEMAENIDYGDTELRALLEGDRRMSPEEPLGAYGYQEQEFKNNELVSVGEEVVETALDDEYTLDDDVDLADDLDDLVDDGEEE